ncbi:hypothetical protein, partial [Emticicia sp. W12TSBA100-4]|uniref:hypothetical protein n=1 Tax=Emticicia sp. W12TSBA100-4 TaxID=3160965 RepID=UPI003305BF5B
MKNKNLLPLLAVAAGGLYLANQNKSKESENKTNSLAFTDESTFADEEALKEKFIELVKSNNTQLRALLRGWDGTKGDKGDQGLQGIQGIQGVKGDKGD